MNFRKVVPSLALFAFLFVGVIWVLWPVSEDGSEAEPHKRVRSPQEKGVSGVSETPATPSRAVENSAANASGSRFVVAETGGLLEEAPEAEALEDVGTDPEPPVDVSRETWSDPVNQKVLGERRWMPEPGPEELKRIQAILNTPMPPTLLGVEARAQAISEMQWHIDACHTQFPTGGRLVVIWQIRGDGKLATSRDVRLGPVVDVVDERFLECVLGFVPPPSPTTERFQMTAEYPVFLDELAPK